MGKCINSSLCITSMASFFVAIIDIVLGGVTLYFSWLSIKNIKQAETHFKNTNTKEDVLWFGIISIPFVAAIGLWSGIKLLYCLYRRSQESNHILKFMVFFMAEVIGFAAPFYIFENYVSKIKAITSLTNNPYNFIIFHLLEINLITITLFIYQIFSFGIVHRHKLLTGDKKFEIEGPSLTILSFSPKSDDADRIFGDSFNTKPSGHAKLRLEILPSPLNSEANVSDDMDSDSESSETEESSALHLQHRLIRCQQISKFEMLKQRCIQKQILYIDNEFPANQDSIGSRYGLHFEWKRPHEIQKDALFFINGGCHFHVRQGKLGNCWFLAAVGNLSLNEDLFKQVVLHDNEWTESRNYAGICHFRFWVKNAWKEVIIDDRLPTQNGDLVFINSSNPCEFWSPLLEKAYAKLNGCYSNVTGKDGIARVMENLTGGTFTRHHLLEFENNPYDLFQMICRSLRNGQFVGTCIRIRPTEGTGLYAKHSYSITHAKMIQITNKDRVAALRIRNPWGSENEWKGNIWDSHPIWDSVDETTRKDLQLIFKADGEFWVPLDDFIFYFDIVEICYLP